MLFRSNNPGKVQGTGINFTGENDISILANLMNSGVNADTYGDATTVPKITVNAQGLITDVTTESIVNIGGNAGSASKLNPGSKIGINTASTGDSAGKVKGAGVNFDGTSDISIDGNLMNSGVTADTYGSTTVFPVVSVNAQGVLTEVTTKNFADIIVGQGNKIAIANKIGRAHV